jgi:hypothetical protein
LWLVVLELTRRGVAFGWEFGINAHLGLAGDLAPRTWSMWGVLPARFILPWRILMLSCQCGDDRGAQRLRPRAPRATSVRFARGYGARAPRSGACCCRAGGPSTVRVGLSAWMPVDSLSCGGRVLLRRVTRSRSWRTAAAVC